VDRTIELIRDHGCKPGLAINPATSLDWLDYTLEHLDQVLLMAVNPGFGGQKFITGTLRKIAEVRKRVSRSGRDVRVEVDGGIKVDNIAAVAQAGADTFVSGSAIFGSEDYGATIRAMRLALAQISGVRT
jgi:ribulose-phosphate 3-epimerase